MLPTGVWWPQANIPHAYLRSQQGILVSGGGAKPLGGSPVLQALEGPPPPRSTLAR